MVHRLAMVASLPEVVETKITLAGVRKTFRCRTLRHDRTAGALVVLFVSDRSFVVHDLDLPPGTVTFGHFWAARPYNVYHWMTPEGRTIAHYANLAAATVIAPDASTLVWRDLTLDVLVRPGAPPQVLDEDELPPDLAPAQRAEIDAALAAFDADAPALLPALEADAEVLWPLAFGRRRA